MINLAAADASGIDAHAYLFLIDQSCIKAIVFVYFVYLADSSLEIWHRRRRYYSRKP